MELIDFQNYCELLPDTAADFPFDEQTLVYKLHGKIFALTDFHDFSYISLKCEPNDAEVLRQAYPVITAGYHLNKRHWITLRLDHNSDPSPGQGSSQKSDQSSGRGSNRGAGSRLPDELSDSFIFRLVLNSYYLVLEGLPKRLQQHLPSEAPLTPALERPGRAELEAARKYIATECTPLYLARFDFHFGSGNPTGIMDSVKHALEAYQNPDGGFGYGLEPDFLLPESSPMATTIAFQIIEELAGPVIGEAVSSETKNSTALSADPPMIAEAVRYLEQNYVEERGGWYAVGPAINDYPHAPWWHWNDSEGMTVIDRHWGNPSAEIIAILLRYRHLLSRFSSAEVEAMATRALSRFAVQKAFPSPHEIYCYIRLYHALAQESATSTSVSIQPQLSTAIASLMSTDPSEWSGYVPRPLDFASSPASPLFETVQPYAGRHCRYLLQTLEQGIWQPHWSWGKHYPEAWQQSRRNWAADLTIKNYLLLERFGYLVL